MGDIAKTLLNALNKGAAAVGSAANDLAGTAKAKADQMTATARHNELIRILGDKTWALHQQGVELPAELQELLDELDTLKPEKKVAEERTEPAADQTETAEGQTAEPVQEKKEEPARPAAKPNHRAFGWGVQPSEPVPTMQVRQETEAPKAPSLTPDELPDAEAKPAARTAPSLNVDDVYGADEKQ